MNRRDGLQRGCEIKVQHQFSIAPELLNIAFLALRLAFSVTVSH